MTLQELIEELKKYDKKTKVGLGFHNPHSHRANYSDLAFEPKENTAVGRMLKAAESALGATYTGWKGGAFKMNEDTPIFLAFEGTCGEEIGPTFLKYMCGEYKSGGKK